MILANQKPIYIIGYRESSMTKEFMQEISKTHFAQTIEPDEFLGLKNKQQFQYIVSSWIDLQSRKQITDLVDNYQSYYVSYQYIHFHRPNHHIKYHST